MLRAEKLLAVGISTALGSLACAGTPATWSQPGFGSWSVGANWSTNPHYPNNGTPAGSTYDVAIRDVGVGGGNIRLTDAITIDSLQHSGRFFTLEVGGSLHVNGEVNLAAGTIGFNSGGAARRLSAATLTLAGGTLRTNAGTVADTYINATGGPAFAGGTLSNCTTNAYFSARGLRFTNGITFDGATLTLFGPIDSVRDVQFVGAQTIGGTGEILLAAGGRDPAVLGQSDVGGGTLTIGPGITIRGIGSTGPSPCGQVGTPAYPLINQGTVTVTSGFPPVVIAGSYFQNTGTLRAAGGSLYLDAPVTGSLLGNVDVTGAAGALVISGSFDNTGATLDLADTGTIAMGGGRITGGTITSSNPAIAMASRRPYTDLGPSNFGPYNVGTFDGVTLATTMRLLDGGHQLRIANGLTLVGGRIEIGGGSDVFAVGTQTIAGTGTIQVDAAEMNQYQFGGPGLTVGPDVTVAVAGSNNTSDVAVTMLRNEGAIILGGGGARMVTTVAGSAWTNAGTVTARSGTLNLRDAWTNAGTIAGSGGTVNFEGSWSNLGRISGGGTANLVLKTAPAAFGEMSLSGGTLTVAGSFTSAQVKSVQLSGATLAVADGGALDNTGDAIELTGSGAAIFVRGGSVVGGRLAAPTIFIGGATLDGVTLASDATVTWTGIATPTPRFRNGLVLDDGAVMTLRRNQGYASNNVNFEGAQVIGGDGRIVFDSLDSSSFTYFNASAGTVTIGPAVSVVAPTSAQLSAFAGGRIVNEGGILATRRLVTSGPFVNAGRLEAAAGEVTLGAGWFNAGTTLVTGGVLRLQGTFDNAGIIDVNRTVLVDYAGPSPLGAVAAQLREGYADGAWTGGPAAITSSAARGAASGAHPTAVGYVEATDLFATFPAVFRGQQVDSSTVILQYTLYGDANLDGLVNLKDFNILAANFGQTGRRWSQGDFTYGGAVTLVDFNLLAANFGLSAAGPDLTPQDWANLAAAVPEPGAVILLTLPGLLLRRRCRRR